MNKIVRVAIGAGVPPAVYILDGEKKLAFVDAAWGILQFRQEDGSEGEMAFWAKYRSTPSMLGPFEKVIMEFDFGSLEGFSVEADGTPLKPEEISRLCFFARTDFGVVLVSFNPALVEDAREYVSVFSKHKQMRVLTQHWAVTWLMEIWGTADDE